jgi:flagellar motility protein MotE (MotC chaperone)
LKATEERVDAKQGDRDSAEAQGLKKLVIMYENMKPREAARVFDRLGADVLVPMVLQMNPRKMSEVLAAMTPESAEKLTVALANRARARTDGLAAAPAAALPSSELPAIAPVGQAPARRP